MLNDTSIASAGPRFWLALIVACVVLSMAGALYFQHVLGLAPCPLCVLQRVAIIAVGLVAALGLLASGARLQLAVVVLAIALSLIGAGIAAWHSGPRARGGNSPTMSCAALSLRLFLILFSPFSPKFGLNFTNI